MFRIRALAATLATTLIGGTALAAPAATVDCAKISGLAKGGTFLVLDPALLSGAASGKLELTSLITKGGLSADAATGIVRDGTSAALLLYKASASAPVCFTAPGFTFEPYTADFLTKVSTATTIGSIQVPASQLIAVGGSYYAAALLRAPDDKVIASSAALTAGQCCWTGTKATLPVYRPPVLFVHGLWGDASSLDETRTAILASYRSGATPAAAALYKKTLVTLQYQGARAFDAPVVTNVINDTADEVLAVLAKDRIVGGRVDVVAHSMGGLVVRAVSGSAAYSGPRNRARGVFHDIVTIDTPETGSPLANYLINSAQATLQAPAFSTPWNLWVGAGCGTSDTVQSCFPNLGLPLTQSGDTLQQGAVYALQPGSANLTKLPPANVPNAEWRPISAIWGANVTPTSYLRNSINALIQALYQSSSDAPTSYRILGYVPNDVIVTEASEIAKGPTPGVIQLLAHTGAPTEAMILGLGGDNSNVLQSPIVDSFVYCRLTALALADCPATAANTKVIAEVKTDAAWAPRFMAPNRATISAPDKSVYGETVTVAVTIPTGAALHDIVVLGDHPTDAETVGSIERAGDRALITIRPREIGPIRLNIGVQFADGGVATAHRILHVAAPATSPVEFHPNGHGGNPFVVLRAGETRQMRPTAVYDGIEREVALGSGVTWQRSEGDAISITRDGMVSAVHPGEATLTGRFGTETATLNVLVKPAE
jgi:pimeloyl-ACP methyl ester carboxylesterase